MFNFRTKFHFHSRSVSLVIAIYRKLNMDIALTLRSAKIFRVCVRILNILYHTHCLGRTLSGSNNISSTSEVRTASMLLLLMVGKAAGP
jgi:hypothetical protein